MFRSENTDDDDDFQKNTLEGKKKKIKSSLKRGKEKDGDTGETSFENDTSNGSTRPIDVRSD